MTSENLPSVEYELPGLAAPAEIAVDRWGIPHIRAGNERDVFLAQGFNAGRDRLWQLDIWRKRGLGRLAQDFGPGFLAQDRAARLFLYRGDMDEEWAAYGDCGGQSAAQSFVDGLNAWIALTERRPELLPPEFLEFGTHPERWQASDVVRIRSHARAHNLLSEETRARVLAEGGLEIDRLRKAIVPGHEPAVPAGVDYQSIPKNVLDVFRLATAPLYLSPERLTANLEDAWIWSKVSDLGQISQGLEPDGSNNWVVAGSRTQSGRPILANDPHRVHTLPSIRYVVHLSAPSLNVIGAGEPVLPGIAIGHNDQVAFGLTIFPGDQEDLYVYETHSKNPNLYRYGDGWEEMQSQCEEISVRGYERQVVSLKFTRHGPVVFEDLKSRKAYAVRTVWSEPGTSAYFASLGYLKAQSQEQFADALAHWGAPAVNHVSADTQGNIGWFVAGRVPLRPNWDGLLPVPGDGRYEWSGSTPASELPSMINPGVGFLASANEFNLPEDYPNDRQKLLFEWHERSRSDRIREVLGKQSNHSISHSMDLQCDEISLVARRLIACLPCVSESDTDVSDAVSMLRAWDCSISRTSAAAALFEVWWGRHLKPSLLKLLVTSLLQVKLLGAGDNETLLTFIETSYRESEKKESKGNISDVLRDSLRDALFDCRVLLGPDQTQWAWGLLHTNEFVHPLSNVRKSIGSNIRNVGPLSVGGSESTVQFASYRSNDFGVVNGASLRLVMDVGDWDNSRVINAPGQSGNPTSKHYDDQADAWCNGRYVPMLFSRDAVDVATIHKILLRPQR